MKRDWKDPNDLFEAGIALVAVCILVLLAYNLVVWVQL